MFRGLCALFVVLVFAPVPARAQDRATGSAAGVIEGAVTTQNGVIQLAGAQVVVRDAAHRDVAMQTSEGDGRFRFVALPEGTYRLAVSLAGFDSKGVVVTV